MFIVYKPLSTILLALLLLWLPLASAQTVNVNTATIDELQTIKGIGEKTAQRIIEERERAGNFESTEDLSIRIKGLGKQRADKLIEAGLDFAHNQVEQGIKPSVVAKEVATIKRRFKYNGPASSSEPYLLKVK